MKHILRMFLSHIVGLWFTTQVFPGIVIVGTWQTLVLGGAVLTFLTLCISPILKILFLPITFLTLGLASWFIEVVILWLLTILVPQIQIHAWNFSGASMAGITVPPMQVSYTVSLIVATVLLSLCITIVQYVNT